MYATVTRRRQNAARAQETRERAAREFFPKLRQAPGFISFSLIQGQDGVNTVVTFWESQSTADAFRATGAAEEWGGVLNGMGHETQVQDRGEVIDHITAEARSSV